MTDILCTCKRRSEISDRSADNFSKIEGKRKKTNIELMSVVHRKDGVEELEFCNTSLD